MWSSRGQIREAIVEENRKDIIERLWKGHQARVRRGLPPGGTVPYGYRRNAKTLVIDPAEAVTVRTVFSLAERGETPSGIARLSGRNGYPWTQRQAVAILLRRSIYAAAVRSD